VGRGVYVQSTNWGGEQWKMDGLLRVYRIELAMIPIREHGHLRFPIHPLHRIWPQ